MHQEYERHISLERDYPVVEKGRMDIPSLTNEHCDTAIGGCLTK
jgi:hypothetical protein